MLKDSYALGASEACEKLGVDVAQLGDLITSGWQSAAHYLPQAGTMASNFYQGAANMAHGGASGLIDVMRHNPGTTAALHGAGLYAMGTDVKGKGKAIAGKVKGLFSKAPPPTPKWGMGSKLALGAAGLGAAGLGYHKWKEHQQAKQQQQVPAMHYAPAPRFQGGAPSPYEGY